MFDEIETSHTASEEQLAQQHLMYTTAGLGCSRRTGRCGVSPVLLLAFRCLPVETYCILPSFSQSPQTAIMGATMFKLQAAVLNMPIGWYETNRSLWTGSSYETGAVGTRQDAVLFRSGPGPDRNLAKIGPGQDWTRPRLWPLQCRQLEIKRIQMII
jgi:hypothetical protein